MDLSSESDDEQDTRIEALLQDRQQLTEQILEAPYDAMLYLRRAVVYTNLAYPDLAAGDAYKALLLTDEVGDDSFEYHEQACEALSQYLGRSLPAVLIHGALASAKISKASDPIDPADDIASLAQLAAIRSFQILALSLLLCGCLRSACTFCDRGLAIVPGNRELLETRQYIQTVADRRLRDWDGDVNSLPQWGVVRREVYPWNTHEPDRFSDESLNFLNQQLLKIAPKCAVQVSKLPVLLEGADNQGSYDIIPTCNQLGVFAKEDIAPGEVVLQEYSLLTANNRLKDTVCDACSEELPPLGPNSAAVNCDECYDTVFCSQYCHDQAQELYHPAVCEKDVDSIAKDTEAHDADESLHLLLLARVLAMSVHQEIHPLEVTQIKYIWGDFVSSSSNQISLLLNAGPPPEWTLPFSFAKNIEAPLHILEKMHIDIYKTLAKHDTWVFNTIYAKTRGTASARKNPRDGRPDVAAVHPFWCLANHDCDPNVSWEWGGRMVLWAREERIVGHRPGGIKSGEELLNHYCDITLPVQQRREWANGSLGGWCMCQRCRDETLAVAFTDATDKMEE